MNLCHLKEKTINLSQKNSIYLDTIWCASLGEMVGLSLKYLKCLDQILWSGVWPTVTNDDDNNECISSFWLLSSEPKTRNSTKDVEHIQPLLFIWECSALHLQWLSLRKFCLQVVCIYQNPKFEVTAKAMESQTLLIDIYKLLFQVGYIVTMCSLNITYVIW